LGLQFLVLGLGRQCAIIQSVPDQLGPPTLKADELCTRPFGIVSAMLLKPIGQFETIGVVVGAVLDLL
jgi:hypothetical protein